MHDRSYLYSQTTDHDCGPVAIWNLLVWLGLQGLYSLKDIYRLCKTDPDGTADEDFKQVVAGKIPHITAIYVDGYKKINDILAALEDPTQCLLISHADDSKDSHWSFWFNYNEKDDEVMGANTQLVTDVLTKEEFQTMLKETPIGDRSMFIITNNRG